MHAYDIILTGKSICNVDVRQRRRKVATLKESCKNALWFTETYDIDLVDISFKSSDDKKIVLKYDTSPLPSNTTDSVAEAAEGHGSQEIDLEYLTSSTMNLQCYIQNCLGHI